MPKAERALILLALLPTLILAGQPARADLPRHNPVPGGIAVIPIGGPEDSVPSVQFGTHELTTILEDGTWHALVGLSPDTLPGKYILNVRHEDSESTRRVFRVHPLSAHLRQRMVTLPDEFADLPFERYAGDLGGESATTVPDPVAELETSFELNQVVNQGRYIPYGRLVSSRFPDRLVDHPWITYVTSADEIVFAPAAGVVERIYLDSATGLTVVIAHGNGLVSVLTRLGDTVVRPDERIEAGQVVGTTSDAGIDDQGRVDWFVLLNNNPVDPLELAPAS